MNVSYIVPVTGLKDVSESPPPPSVCLPQTHQDTAVCQCGSKSAVSASEHITQRAEDTSGPIITIPQSTAAAGSERQVVKMEQVR